MWNIIALLVCLFSINYVKPIIIYNPNYSEYYVTCPKYTTAKLAYYFDCRRFLNCTNGERTFLQCPPGTLFHPIKRQCDYAHNVNCLATPNRLSTCSQISNALYPHPNDCTKYIKCSNGVTYINVCAPGTAFDSLRLFCDYKNRAKCCKYCEENKTSEEIVSPSYDDNEVNYGEDLIDIIYDFQRAIDAEGHFGEGLIDIRGGKKKRLSNRLESRTAKKSS